MGGNMGMFASYSIWQEMLAGTDGEPLSDLFYEQYDLVYGAWPENYNEIVLIVDGNIEISDVVLYALGLKTTDEMREELRAAGAGEAYTGEAEKWSYEEICDMTFKMILPPDFYQKNKDGTYTDLSASDAGLTFLYDSDKPIELKVSGIIRPNEDAVSSMMTGSIGYTSALTEYAIARAAESQIVKDQLADPQLDVISGLPYKVEGEEELSDSEKALMIKAHFDSLTVAEKAALYTEIKSVMPETELQAATMQTMAQYTSEQLKALAVQSYAEQMGITDTAEIEQYINAMSEEELRIRTSELEVECEYFESIDLIG